MAISFLYRDLDATDTDITPYVVLRFGDNPQGMSENAEERSVGAWDLQIEDDGALDLHAQRTFYVLEDDTPGADNVLWVGQTFDKHSSRGPVHRTGAGRVYLLNLIDLNTLLERRVIRDADDPDRPAETDVERMQWLEGLGYIGGPSDYLSTDDPVDMDAVDYTGRMASEVIEDCMQQSTKNAFMFRDPDNNIFSTFYGDSSADVDVLTSDIRLSNVLSDVDNVTTWEALLDADLWEANSRIYSGMQANYDGGSVFVENTTTVGNFSHRDTSVSWPDVKSSTKAIARATRQLAIIGSEENRITAALEVESDQVGLMPHAGYRLQARFSHYPSFTEFTWMRILSRQTTLIGPKRYRVQYELSPGPAAAPTVACATVIGSMQTDDSGRQHDLSAYFSPLVWSGIDSPSVYPSVVVGFMAMANQAAAFGSGPTGNTSGFTLLNGSREGTCSYPFGFSTMSIAGYKALSSGAPGNMSVSWAGGGNPIGWRGLAAYIPTAATSPVQVAAQCGSGNTATFPGAPTPGNLLVGCFFSEVGGEAPPSPPVGWTRVAGEAGFAGGVNPAVDTMFMQIYVRCVQTGDGSTYSSGDSSFSHWAFLSEWALT